MFNRGQLETTYGNLNFAVEFEIVNLKGLQT